jgi:hypothetical protein
VAGQLGYCGLDRRRSPLTGDEIRGCWQAIRESRDSEVMTVAARAGGQPRRSDRRVEFVPVGEASHAAPRGEIPPLGEGRAATDTTGRVLRFIFWEDGQI